jgi:EAL domain-containing protein (putative c-di-GMP-specific phosphodiesterase class I)
MADIGIASTLPDDEAQSEESLLLDQAKRIGEAPKDYFAIHVHLSELRPQYRQPHYIRIAARSFDNLASTHEATLYILGNADMVLICRDVPVNEIDAPVLKLRTLFSEDPLTFGAEGSLDDRFTTWYDLAESSDFVSFLATVEDLAAAAEERLQKAREADTGAHGAMRGEALTPTNLTDVNTRLQGVRIDDLIHRQSVVEVHPGAKGDVVFQEHYVSMMELRARIAPEINLFSDAWLFQYLTETVDRRILSVLAQFDFAAMRDDISVNLNIATVLSPGFQNFHEKARDHASRVVIEIQIIDIFSDFPAYASARDWLQGHGYRMLIDGLNPLALQFFDPGTLAADFVKVNWNPQFLAGIPDDRMTDMRQAVESVGGDGMILARADSEDAIKWALGLGIHRFQGHFIDRVVDAMITKGII